MLVVLIRIGWFVGKDTAMQYRKLGRTGIKVSAMCLGTMTYGNQVGETEAISIIERALNAGVNFFWGQNTRSATGQLPTLRL